MFDNIGKGGIMKMINDIKSTIFMVTNMQIEDADLSLSNMGIDSLKLIEIIVRLETLIGVKVPLELLTLENFDTIDKILKLFSELKKE